MQSIVSSLHNNIIFVYQRADFKNVYSFTNRLNFIVILTISSAVEKVVKYHYLDQVRLDFGQWQKEILFAKQVIKFGRMDIGSNYYIHVILNSVAQWTLSSCRQCLSQCLMYSNLLLLLFYRVVSPQIISYDLFPTYFSITVNMLERNNKQAILSFFLRPQNK